MQRSKIEWTEYTSNPIRGRCLHACSYCYAEQIRIKYKQPAGMHWHPEELIKIRGKKKAATIFIGSMYDIFGEWVEGGYIDQILDTAKACPQHTFLFLTKNPVKVSRFDFSDNCWVGVTDDCMGSDTYPLDDFGEWITGTNKFISFEPLLGALGTQIPSDISQIIIGAMTGKGGKVIKPEIKWVTDIIDAAGDRPIYIKDNLLDILPEALRGYYSTTRLRRLEWRLNDWS